MIQSEPPKAETAPDETAPQGRSLAQLRLERLIASMGVAPQNFLISFELSDAVTLQWGRFEKMVQRCRREFSAEAVHDARVHCRRLIARLQLVQEAVPAKGLPSALRSLKRLLKSLGELRDVQVQQLALAAELSRYPEVGGLWIELGRREQKLIQSAARSLDGFKLGKIRRQLEEVQAGLKNPAARLAAKAVLGESILRATQQAFEATAERACDIDADEVSTVHRVRTAYKKFRYMVEALPAALGRPSEAQAAAMAEYQQAMGAIQDVDVLLNLVADHGAQDPGVAWSLESFRKALLDRRTWLVDEFIARADALYSFWPLQSEPLGILQTAV